MSGVARYRPNLSWSMRRGGGYKMELRVWESEEKKSEKRRGGGG